MFGVWFSTRQQREMNKLYNITRIAEECAECIAMMKLEEVAYLDELQNPNKIQKSFIKIIKTLREYRDYIPSSVLMGDTVKVEESDSESAAVPQVSEVSASVASFNSIGKSRSGPLNVHLNHLAICALRKRNVTVQCVNFSGFHRVCLCFCFVPIFNDKKNKNKNKNKNRFQRLRSYNNTPST